MTAAAFQAAGEAIDWPALLRPAAGPPELMKLGAGPALVARHCRWGQPVYLATPYTRRAAGPDGCWCAERSRAALAEAAREAARLAAVGVTAVSPVVLAVSMVEAEAEAGAVPGPRLDPMDEGFWRDWCRPILDACCAVVVPDLPGWRESAGVWREVRLALAWQRPVFLYAEGADAGD